MAPEQSMKPQYLMLRFFEGSIAEDEFEILNQFIKKSDTAQNLYFSYLKVYLALKSVRYLDHFSQSDIDSKSFLCELGKYENFAPPVEEQKPPEKEESLPLEKLHIEKTPHRFNKHSFYTALIALAAMILLIVVIHILPPRVILRPIARILDSSKAEWVQEKDTKNRTLLFEGPLTVTKGTLKFAMYDGSEINLHAPAIVELERIDQLYLQQGSMLVVVTPVAAGFTVRTPSGSVVDYGTEFSVAVDSKGATQVEIVKGVVELRDSSNPLRFKVAQKLIAGQIGTIDSSGKISYRDVRRPDDDVEVRVRWECSKPTGLWTRPSYWTNGLVRGLSLVSEFRAEDAPKMVIVDSTAAGSGKIFARRADVGLLSKHPVTVQMKGGQVQLEQLWVGRMSESDEGQGLWLMEDGEIVLKGRDYTVLLIGDKGKGQMEINGGSVEAYGSARVGCMQGDGTLVMNGGTMTINGTLEVAIEESAGAVYLNGGQIKINDLRIDKRGVLSINGGTLIIQDDRTEHIQYLMDTGYIQSPNHKIVVEYDDTGDLGFGVNKTIIHVKD